MKEPKIIAETHDGITKISIADKLLQENEIWVEGEITVPVVNEIISLLHIIEQRCANDAEGIIVADVRLFIAGPGGSISAALNLANYLKHTPLNITGIAVNSCASSSALIWLACKNREILPYSRLMLHEVSHMVCENIRYRTAKVEEILSDLSKLNDDVYELIAEVFGKTKEAVRGLLHGKDYYLSAKDVENMGIATIVDTL